METRRHLVSGTGGAGTEVNGEATGGRRPRPGGQRARGPRASGGDACGEPDGTHRREPRIQRAAGLPEIWRSLAAGRDPKSPRSPHGPRPSQHPLARSPHTPEGHAPPWAWGLEFGTRSGWDPRGHAPRRARRDTPRGYAPASRREVWRRGSPDSEDPAPPRLEAPPSGRGWGRGGGCVRPRGLGPRGPGGGDEAGRVARERSRGARRGACEVRRGVAGEQWPGVTPRGYF